MGAVGTGLWRVPEVLQRPRDRVPLSDLEFTTKCDVYSYSVTCYELATGRLPLEELSFPDGRDFVLKGVRLELPVDLNSFVASYYHLLASCSTREA